MISDRPDCSVRCAWGERGLTALAAESDVVIIVDVLSFSTCVDIAVSRGATVYPVAKRDAVARAFAGRTGAELAGPRGKGRYSLSPACYLDVSVGTRVVLPSPNGSALSCLTGENVVLAGCLRNAEAVARSARRFGGRIAVIPAGERWTDGSLRPCIEDWLGAGAIIRELGGSCSAEAAVATSTFEACEEDLLTLVRDSVSGRELIELGFEGDIELACDLNASHCVPRLIDGAYVDVRLQQG